jgi:hypothetical protein
MPGKALFVLDATMRERSTTMALEITAAIKWLVTSFHGGVEFNGIDLHVYHGDNDVNARSRIAGATTAVLSAAVIWLAAIISIVSMAPMSNQALRYRTRLVLLPNIGCMDVPSL